MSYLQKFFTKEDWSELHIALLSNMLLLNLALVQVTEKCVFADFMGTIRRHTWLATVFVITVIIKYRNSFQFSKFIVHDKLLL